MMKLGLRLAVAFMAMASALTTTPSRAESAAALSAKQAVAAASQQFLQSIAAKDAVKAASFYSEDAHVLATGMDLRGRAAMQDLYVQSLAQTSIEMGSTILIASDSGDLVVDTGWVKFPTKDNAAGKYMITWQKQADGQWKMARLMLNMDQ